MKRSKCQFGIVEVLFLLLVLFISGCASTKSAKLGVEIEQQGDHFRAAQLYLDALNKNARQKDAVNGIVRVAESAYQQKLNLAQNQVDQGSHETAIQEFTQLQLFLNQLRTHNALSFSTINVGEAIGNARQATAEKYYVLGEEAYANSNYLLAVQEFGRAQSFVSGYKEVSIRLASSHYKLGNGMEKSGAYRDAIKQYAKANEIISGYEDATQRIGSIYYHLGDYFLMNGQCRLSVADLGQSMEWGHAASDLPNKLNDARECGTTRIAFVEFENRTGRDLVGMDLGDVIFEEIKTKTQQGASDFIRMMDREQLNMLLREQDINEGMLRQGSRLPNTLEGVDYLVFGKINQVHVEQPELKTSVRQDEYEYKVERPYTDDKGKQKIKTEWIKQPLAYRFNEQSITINLSGSVSVVDAHTGESVINYQIDERAFDEIGYVKDYQARHDINDTKLTRISDDLRAYNKARKELRDMNSLVKEKIDVIAAAMTDKILATLDQPTQYPDPTTLPIELPVVSAGGK